MENNTDWKKDYRLVATLPRKKADGFCPLCRRGADHILSSEKGCVDVYCNCPPKTMTGDQAFEHVQLDVKMKRAKIEALRETSKHSIRRKSNLMVADMLEEEVQAMELVLEFAKKGGLLA